MIDRRAIRQRWEADGSKRDERGRRLFAASEARAAGWGGLAAVSNITGLARSTIERGLKDLDAPPLAPGQVRRKGGGPRPLTETECARTSWQRIGGESPPRGRSSQPPRPRVMHEVLLARAAVKRSQGRPRAEHWAAKRV